MKCVFCYFNGSLNEASTLKLFISQTSFLREEAEERLNQLSNLGLESNLSDNTLSDDDVELVPIKIPYDKIIYSYQLGEGFQVGLISGDSFWCLDDPFSNKEDRSYSITISDKSDNI